MASALSSSHRLVFRVFRAGRKLKSSAGRSAAVPERRVETGCRTGVGAWPVGEYAQGRGQSPRARRGEIVAGRPKVMGTHVGVGDRTAGAPACVLSKLATLRQRHRPVRRSRLTLSRASRSKPRRSKNPGQGGLPTPRADSDLRRQAAAGRRHAPRREHPERKHPASRPEGGGDPDNVGVGHDHSGACPVRRGGRPSSTAARRATRAICRTAHSETGQFGLICRGQG